MKLPCFALPDFRRHRFAFRSPGGQPAIENRRPIAEAQIIKREINARRWRHPILAEVNYDPRLVREAQLFKGSLQLIDWRQLQNQSGAPRSRDVRELNELRSGNVRSVILALVPTLQQHE